MVCTLNLLANLFPIWVVVAGVLALIEPGWFAWFAGNWITWGLAIIMLGMGVTLTLEDFQRVAKRPGLVVIGFVAQFLIMPSLGWTLAKLFQLEPGLAVGLILVSCCPGGTASNVVTYIARADVALSVLMTMCSTFGAVIMTPALTSWLAGSYVPVDFWQLLFDTLKVVIAPVVAGVLLNHFVPRLVRAINPVAPLVSVIFIALICGGIIARNADPLKESAGELFAAVSLLHVGGFGLGYLFAALWRCHQAARQTISIEVGMQNSGLGAALAQKNFSTLPAATLPAAISATLHSVIGSLLAVYWRWRNSNKSPGEPPQTN